MKDKGHGNEHAHGNKHEAVDKDEEIGSIIDGFSPYKDVDCTAENKNTKTPAPKESSTPACDTNVVYAVVDMSKKKGAKETENGSPGANKDDQNVMPMKMEGTEVAQVANESSTPASDTKGQAVYAVVDKSKKKPKNGRDNVTTFENKDAIPMEQEHKMTDEEEGMLAEGSVQEAQCNNTEGLKYTPTADVDPGQQCEGDRDVTNVDTLYAAVDKSQKKIK